MALSFTSACLADGPQRFNDDDFEALGVSADEVAKIDAQLKSFVDEQKLGSVTAFVAKGGNVVYRKAFGWKDIEKKVPATVDDYYVLFSQTKAVTTVAFMTLVEEGLVAIDDPVSKYFPEIPNVVVTKVNPDGTYETQPVKSPMTFVHLMSHTSGLGSGLVRDIRRARQAPDDAPAGFGGAVPAQAPAGRRSGGGNPRAKTLEEEMQALAKYPLGFEPGTRWDYHVSTNMLAYLVERISKKPLREYVKEKILVPLGMNETDWYYKPEALTRFVKPYRVANGKLEPGPSMYSEGAISEQQTYVEGAIGLNGPIEDYAKFCQMLLNKGEFNGHRILKLETVDLMTTINRLPKDAPGAEKGFQFGLGFELHKEKKPVPAVSDSAFAWGGMFGTAYLVDPASDLVVLFYMNMYQPEALYPKFLTQVYKTVAATSPVSVAKTRAATEGNVVLLEKGGSGPYAAIVTEDTALPGMTIFRPGDLTPFSTDCKLPILLWGNGACANTTYEHKNFLSEIASHGYVVLAIGLLEEMNERGEKSRQPTQSKQMIAALDWILEQNKLAGSIYSGKMEASKVAAMGMSCGGLQAIEISDDPRITTTVVCNSGVLPTPSPLRGMPALSKGDLKKYHGPVLYIIGGPSDIAYRNAMDDFARVNHVPFVMASHDVGHGGTYHLPRGGEFTRVALPWLDWHLKGKQEASKMFLSEDSELRRNPKWTIKVKNFAPAKEERN
jgi:CubicO group peptidase (beta-lactamase class C family)